MGNGLAVRRARSAPLTRLTLAIVIGVVIVALTACASSSKPSATITSSATTSTAASGTNSSGSSPASTSSSAGDCGGAVARVTTAVKSFPEVTKVDTIAACHEVDIQTNLPGGVLGSPSATKGTEICDAAAMVAYQGDVSSITVTATDGHELAAGLSTAPCIPG